jgi:hypothetical protein
MTPLTVALDGPLMVTLSVRRPQDQEALVVFDEREMSPGDTLTFAYPDEGFAIDFSTDAQTGERSS